MEAILGLAFFSFKNIDIRFTEIDDLTLINYIATEALPTTKRVEFIKKKEFAKVTLDQNAEMFVIHFAVLLSLSIHLRGQAQLGLL